MTDAEYKESQERVKKIVDYYCNKMDMGIWNIRIQFYREGMESNKPEDPNWASLFSVVSYWEYQKAMISVNCPVVLEVEDEEICKAVIHELIHIIISPMHKGNDPITIEHEEFVVTTLSKLFLHHLGYLKKEPAKKKAKK